MIANGQSEVWKARQAALKQNLIKKKKSELARLGPESGLNRQNGQVDRKRAYLSWKKNHCRPTEHITKKLLGDNNLDNWFLT